MLGQRNGHGSKLDDHAATPNDLLSRRNMCGLRSNPGRERNKAGRQPRSLQSPDNLHNTVNHIHHSRARNSPGKQRNTLHSLLRRALRNLKHSGE
jgi:hypothetical protein